MYEDFEDFYATTCCDGDNEELETLIRTHMGTLHGLTLRQWLEHAFNAGKECAKSETV